MAIFYGYRYLMAIFYGYRYLMAIFNGYRYLMAIFSSNKLLIRIRVISSDKYQDRSGFATHKKMLTPLRPPPVQATEKIQVAPLKILITVCLPHSDVMLLGHMPGTGSSALTGSWPRLCV